MHTVVDAATAATATASAVVEGRGLSKARQLIQVCPLLREATAQRNGVVHSPIDGGQGNLGRFVESPAMVLVKQSILSGHVGGYNMGAGWMGGWVGGWVSKWAC